MAAIHLFQCASEHLVNLMLNDDREVTKRTEAEVPSLTKKHAVLRVSLGVVRAGFMTQDSDERFSYFATRVREKASTCEFNIEVRCNKCGETNHTKYTEEVIKDVILAGIADVDIRREVLGIEGIQSRSVNDIIRLVRTKEVAQCN